MKTVQCLLCRLDLKKEKIYYDDKSFLVLRTKNLKGHKERIMILYKQHEHTMPYKAFERALDLLFDIGKKVISHTPKFVIMDTTFATIDDHWHLVGTNLGAKSKDFDQVLATGWIKVVDNAVVKESEV